MREIILVALIIGVVYGIAALQLSSLPPIAGL